MSIEVKVPQLPESVSDAILVAWHKGEGDSVDRDENLVDLETDKVVLEVPAPRAGILKSIKVQDGATVTTGDVLAILEDDSDGAGAKPKKQKSAGGGSQAGDGDADEDGAEAKAAKEAPAAKRRSDGDGGKAAQAGEAGDADEGGDGNGDPGSSQRLSPAVRRLVEQHELDPSDISGSGRDGRLTKADVLEYIGRDRDPGGEDSSSEAPAADATAERNDRRVPMTRLRTRIAERLVEAQQSAAMLTTFNEIDLTEVIGLRNRYKDRFEKENGVKLGFMSFFIKASIEALRRFPVINASVEDSDIIYHDYHDIGIAVSTERGLLVPVLRDADRLSFAEVEKSINDFGQRARKGQITMDELTGGTFTITNGGIFGSMMSTPILNPPQSGILGMHKIQQRPMVVDGGIVARPMMYIALTYDHRIIDGREAVQFLVAVKDALEDPARLLLQI